MSHLYREDRVVYLIFFVFVWLHPATFFGVDVETGTVLYYINKGQ